MYSACQLCMYVQFNINLCKNHLHQYFAHSNKCYNTIELNSDFWWAL